MKQCSKKNIYYLLFSRRPFVFAVRFSDLMSKGGVKCFVSAAG
jgi:hypothetical protein